MCVVFVKLIVLVGDFVYVLFDVDMSVFDGIVGLDGKFDFKCFNVYWNNVVVSFIEVFFNIFLVIVLLFGDDYFLVFVWFYVV